MIFKVQQIEEWGVKGGLNASMNNHVAVVIMSTMFSRHIQCVPKLQQEYCVSLLTCFITLPVCFYAFKEVHLQHVCMSSASGAVED